MLGVAGTVLNSLLDYMQQFVPSEKLLQNFEIFVHISYTDFVYILFWSFEGK